MGKDDQKAGENPLWVAVNESTGEICSRLVGRKGMGQEGEMDWVVKDLAEELRTWGHAGGPGGKLIMKCDNEASIRQIREAVAKLFWR